MLYINADFKNVWICQFILSCSGGQKHRCFTFSGWGPKIGSYRPINWELLKINICMHFWNRHKNLRQLVYTTACLLSDQFWKFSCIRGLVVDKMPKSINFLLPKICQFFWWALTWIGTTNHLHWLRYDVTKVEKKTKLF